MLTERMSSKKGAAVYLCYLVVSANISTNQTRVLKMLLQGRNKRASGVGSGHLSKSFRCHTLTHYIDEAKKVFYQANTELLCSRKQEMSTQL